MFSLASKKKKEKREALFADTQSFIIHLQRHDFILQMRKPFLFGLSSVCKLSSINYIRFLFKSHDFFEAALLCVKSLSCGNNLIAWQIQMSPIIQLFCWLIKYLIMIKYISKMYFGYSKSLPVAVLNASLLDLKNWKEKV